MHLKVSRFDIISTICVILLTIPVIVFYHFRDYSVKLSLNGTITNTSKCIQTSHCRDGSCIVELSGYVTLNYIYDNQEYITETSPAECCAGDCCREIEYNHELIWIILDNNRADSIKTFSCTQFYINDIYILLFYLSVGIFVCGLIFLVLVWCDKIKTNEKIPLINNP